VKTNVTARPLRATYTSAMDRCATCGAENPSDARFCASCGTSLVPACRRCGAELPEGSRFCSACGTPVEELPEPGRERKIVTVMFADVVGSTTLGERLDPESLRDVMGSFFDAMREEIEAEGGTVEKYIGDAIMAAFGAPQSHEDDPTRAVRAAYRMLVRLVGLNEELSGSHDVELQIRVGINTGEVIAVTEARPGDAIVTGDAVNAAARLEQQAEPGQVLVSLRTARAARIFRFKPLGEVRLTGKEQPIEALELVASVPQPERIVERGVPGLRAPLVGRDDEVALLQGVYRRVTAEGIPHLVTIYGDPGVGKSRLTAEFVEWADLQDPPPLVLRGRCLPYGDGVTYWPLAEILKERAGVLDTDPAEGALQKIRTFAASFLAEGLSPDPARAAAALAFTVGLEDPRHDFATIPPRQVRLELHAAWRSLFSGLAQRRPLILVVEDIHWADPALLDLLEELAGRVVGPTMIIAPSRPELTQRRPGWGGGRRNYTGVSLEPLSREDAQRLVGFLLTVEELPDPVRDRILARAEGNPFFLEEIIRQLIDEKQIVRRGNRWTAAEAIGEVVIPDTVQAVLAARIDLLEPAEKRTLQSAAVVGRVFWTGPVGKLLNGEAFELDELLTRLEERELVAARVGSTIGGQREYSFKHVLTRDVAYGTLPRGERARAHAAVAGWIESTAGERQAEFAELLAYHYLEAYRAARDDPQSVPGDTEALRLGAFSALLTASREARRRLALEKAEHLAKEAVSIAATDPERSEALEPVGDALFLQYYGERAWEVWGRAIEAQPRTTGEDRRRLARLCAKRADVPTRWPGSMRSVPTAEEVRAVIDLGFENLEAGDSTTKVRLLVARAFWPFGFPQDLAENGDEAARRDAEEAVAMALRLARPDLASAALDAVAASYLAVGDYGGQQRVLERRLALVPELNDPFELGDLFAVAAWGEFHIGRYPATLTNADEGVARSEGTPGVDLHCLTWRILALIRMGRWEEAVAALARMNELLGDRWAEPPGFALRAFGGAAYLLECMGNRGAADRYLAVALDQSQRGPLGAVSWIGELFARRGEFDRARATMEGADLTVRRTNAGLILEARCEVVAEQGSWEDADKVVEESRAHAAQNGLQALPAFADRLEGRAALATGQPEAAARSLRHALDRFASLEAGWEEARTRLDLASALVSASPARARAEAAAAYEDLVRIGAARETAHARDLLASLGETV
jgi:class 3 adenylate cyclase/tetratricopeptide (TPR) repeat protein